MQKSSLQNSLPAISLNEKLSRKKTQRHGETRSDQQRLEQLCEWRRLISKAKKQRHEHGLPGSIPADEEEAMREVTACCKQLALQREQAAAAFWSHLEGLKMPAGMHFVPFVESKWFTGRECLQCPLQAAARLWFRWMSEERDAQQAVQRMREGKHCCRATLTTIHRLRDQYESADRAWKMHIALCRAESLGIKITRQENAGEYPGEGFEPTSDSRPTSDSGPTLGSGQRWDRKLVDAASLKTLEALLEDALTEDVLMNLMGLEGPMGFEPSEAAVDYLAAWAAAEIGETYLRPLMARTRPGAGPEQLRRELLLEVWGIVLALNAGRLPVRDFCCLPVAAARNVRQDYTDAADHISRLVPATQQAMRETSQLAASQSASDPEEALVNADTAALLWKRVQALPLRQRQAICLAAEGQSRWEMAREMGCGEETVKTHLERGRRRLQAELAIKGDLED